MFAIDPHNITNYNRSDEELELFWLFSVLVAGKNSRIQAGKLDEFLSDSSNFSVSPFSYIRYLVVQDFLRHTLEVHKLGQYNRLVPCFEQSLDLDLRKCSVEDLEAIHGVGPKTARFFILHTRRDEHHAVLDTHILRWMREELGVDTPKNTPTGKRYFELEKVFLNYCAENSKFPAELDLEIWSKYNKGNKQE